MRRLLAVLGLVAAMVVSGAGVALAHPAPAEQNAKGFNSEPLLKGGIQHANPNGLNNGIIPGFVVHSPACAGHPNFHDT